MWHASIDSPAKLRAISRDLEAGNTAFASLSVNTFHNPKYVELQAGLWTDAKAANRRVLCLLPSAKETHEASERLAMHLYRLGTRPGEGSIVHGRLPDPDSTQISFMTYRSFASAMVDSTTRLSAPIPIVVAQESPRLTTDVETSLYILRQWYTDKRSGSCFFLLGVWKSYDQCRGYLGPSGETLSIGSVLRPQAGSHVRGEDSGDQLAAKIYHTVMVKKQNVLVFTLHLDRFLAFVEQGQKGPTEEVTGIRVRDEPGQDVPAEVSVAAASSGGHGVVLGITPLLFSDEVKLPEFALMVSEIAYCAFMPRESSPVPLLQCRELTENQLLLHHSFTTRPVDVHTLLYSSKEELAQGREPEREAFNEDPESFTMDLIALWPGRRPVTLIPVQHADDIERTCRRLKFLGLVQKQGQGYAVTDKLGRSFITVSTHLPMREPSSTVHLIARAAAHRENPKLQRILVRMAITNAAHWADMVQGDPTDASRTFSSQPLDNPDDDDVGTFALDMAGVLWHRLCCWDTVRESTRNFQDTPEELKLAFGDDKHYPVDLKIARSAWDRIQDLERLLDIPSGPEGWDAGTTIEEQAAIERDLFWAFADRLVGIKITDNKPVQVRSLVLQTGGVVHLDGNSLVEMLTLCAMEFDWPPQIPEGERWLIGIAEMEFVDGKLVATGVTVLTDWCQLIETCNSAPGGAEFLNRSWLYRALGCRFYSA